ncbi:uncharacterized protein LOC120000666 [Tripterygium wilfordii]|uniref:uncharacterized protein LOC120000666 n=1 Tax=Tripterygium wilfordii TaxID=458696 RepID=UPI0018F83727|nr:uncharacterized protein LOC120000666 [Tripterygium wilfordii]
MGEVVRWPEKHHKLTDERDASKWCDFHNNHGRTTEDYFVLKKEVNQLLKKVYLCDLLTEKGKETIAQAEKSVEERRLPPPEKNSPCNYWRIRNQWNYAFDYREIRKKMINSGVWVEKLMVQFTRQVISFTDDESIQLLNPHNDALVITLQITNCENKRIMIDDGSSANLLLCPSSKQ